MKRTSEKKQKTNEVERVDTIIKNSKTVTKLPGGSKSKLIESLSFLNKKFSGKQIKVHSGHGESFWFEEVKNIQLLE